MLAVSQLSRAVEYRGNKRPVLADLRDSGGIEQAADLVWLLYRERYYNALSSDASVEVNVAKHRNGPTGVVKLYYHENQARFSNMMTGAMP